MILLLKNLNSKYILGLIYTNMNSRIIKKYFSSQKYMQSGSVYVHWPYCKRRCSYCNFVKFIHKENTSWSFSDDIIENAMVLELGNIMRESPIKEVTSVFFGGGTPSLGRPQLVEKILDTISKTCSISSNAEVTLEANPTALETKKLLDFKKAGVNRLSLGIQTLDDELLRLLNRDHSAKEALSCLEEGKKLYPHKLSVDLIFALPRQTIEMWKKNLELIMNVCDDHLSLYQLTVEQGTDMYKQVKSGILTLPTEDEVADMYNLAVIFMANEGFRRYEVSNFANSSQSESRHNKAIWQGGQYAGIGPGAHSRMIIDKKINDLGSWIREARINAPDPNGWLNEVYGKGNGTRKVVQQTSLDIQLEYIATSLRTDEGATEERWSLFSSSSLETVFGSTVMDPELLILSNGKLKATSKGMNVLDALLPRLILGVTEFYHRSIT